MSTPRYTVNRILDSVKISSRNEHTFISAIFNFVGGYCAWDFGVSKYLCMKEKIINIQSTLSALAASSGRVPPVAVRVRRRAASLSRLKQPQANWPSTAVFIMEQTSSANKFMHFKTTHQIEKYDSPSAV
jgi:hypothetical protein